MYDTTEKVNYSDISSNQLRCTIPDAVSMVLGHVNPHIKMPMLISPVGSVGFATKPAWSNWVVGSAKTM